MEIATPASASAPVKAAEVNCEPWSVLKISGLPNFPRASSSAARQNETSIMFDSRHASTAPIGLAAEHIGARSDRLAAPGLVRCVLGPNKPTVPATRERKHGRDREAGWPGLQTCTAADSEKRIDGPVASDRRCYWEDKLSSLAE
jgi:hypothetical protein